MYSLSEKAAEDLENILDYSYVNFGMLVMQDYYDSLDKCLNTLDRNPDLGLKTEYVSLNYRCFYHRSHMIFYKKSAHGIYIVRLLHKSMDVSQHLID